MRIKVFKDGLISEDFLNIKNKIDFVQYFAVEYTWIFWKEASFKNNPLEPIVAIWLFLIFLTGTGKIK